MLSTRSHSKNIYESKRKNIECYLVKSEITDAMNDKNYELALKLIQNVIPSTHWYVCTLVEIMLSLNKSIHQILAVLKPQIRKQQFFCPKCFEFFISQIYYKDNEFKQQYLLQVYAINSNPKVMQPVKSKALEVMKDIAHYKNEYSLLNYYTLKGAKFAYISVLKIQKNFRATIALDRIWPEQNILFIPQNELISSKICEQSPIVQALFPIKKKLNCYKHIKFGLFLLMEKASKNSYYKKYLKFLPDNLDNFPINSDEDTLKQLKSTDFYQNTLQYNKQLLLKDYRLVVKHISQFMPNLTFKQFVWAKFVVSSRMFGLQVQGVSEQFLVPVADMVNHKRQSTTKWYYCAQRKGFALDNGSQKTIEAGEQIFDNYGKKCNSRFFYNYGFTLMNNPSNQITIPLLRYKKWGIKKRMDISKNYNSPVFLNCLSYYRKTILQKQTETQNDEAIFSKFINRPIQIKVWQSILFSFEQRLKQYPTSLSYDKRLLNKLERGIVRECVNIRIGQKQILHFYIKMSKFMIKYFKNPLDYAQSEEVKTKYQEFFDRIMYIH